MRIVIRRPVVHTLLLWGLLLPVSVSARDVSGTAARIVADATDNVGVVGVQFLLDGQPLGPEDTGAPYEIVWDTTSVPDGPYALTAVARDAAGNEGVAAPVTVTVNNAGIVDTASPTSIVTSPANGATVSGVIPVAASASDDVGVEGAQFFLDGAPLGSEDTQAPYTVSLDTRLISDGAHVLTARARDGAGNQATSAGVTVFVSNAPGGNATDTGGGTSDPVADTSAPSVQTTGPGQGATVSAVVQVTASAVDNVGVAGVQFLLDGVLLGVEDASPPYALAWDTTAVSDGPHILSARARDAAGNQSLSAGIAVSVANSDDGEESSGDSGAPPDTIDGKVALSVGQSIRGFRTIQASVDAGDALSIYIDGQLVLKEPGRSIRFDWDIRGLLGSHEVQVVSTGPSGILASASVFQAVDSARPPSVGLDVRELPILGATVIQANADVAGAVRLELYVDGELLMTEDASKLEYAWDPEGRAHEILFAAYDALGVVASVSAVYDPGAEAATAALKDTRRQPRSRYR